MDFAVWGSACRLFGALFLSIRTTVNAFVVCGKQRDCNRFFNPSKWLSLSPAKLLGLSNRGSIGKGKLADLVVWTPYCRSLGKGNEFYQDLSIFDGKEMFGVIHKVYLRGVLAYDNGNYVKAGKRVERAKK